MVDTILVYHLNAKEWLVEAACGLAWNKDAVERNRLR
jgi:hypothetical protein